MQTLPATSKEALRAIKILFYILFIGVVLSTATVFILIKIKGQNVKPGISRSDAYPGSGLSECF